MNITRRSLLFLASIGPWSIRRTVRAQQSATADDEPKREFIERANKEWQKDYDAVAAAAREREKHGEFSSLSPPLGLVPFKDWDYYYTKGFMQWRPNAGQVHEPVVVPPGFVTDLASVPQWAWSSGIRPEGPYAYAAIVHDFLYWVQERNRDEADAIFLIAMEDSKVDKPLRESLYQAVRLAGGSAWDNNARLKRDGEHRLLRQTPTDFTISWQEWKRRPGVFRD